MFRRALRATLAMSAAIGLAVGAAAVQAAPADELDGFDSVPAPVLQGQVLQASRSTFDLRIDGDRATRADRLHRTSPLAGDVTWLPRQELLFRGTLMRTQLSEDASLSVRLRRGRLSLYLSISLPMRNGLAP